MYANRGLGSLITDIQSLAQTAGNIYQQSRTPLSVTAGDFGPWYPSTGYGAGDFASGPFVPTTPAPAPTNYLVPLAIAGGLAFLLMSRRRRG